MSHLGRPDGMKNLKDSLLPVANHLSQLLENKVLLVNNYLEDSNFELSEVLLGVNVAMLENLRFYKEETEGNEDFALRLAKLGDVYVNDAFGTAHRAHASTSIIAQYFASDKKCFGLLMEAEVNSLKLALSEGKSPKVAIVGGAKVSSKIDVLKSLITKVDKVVIGGGMAYTFMKAQGGNIGKSLCEDDRLEMANDLLAKGFIDAAAFGRPYIANPDLAHRLKLNAPLNEINPATLYGGAEEGYTDYPALT